MRNWWAAVLAGFLSTGAWAGNDLSFGVLSPEPGEKPTLVVTPVRPLAEITVVVTAGDDEFSFSKTSVSAGQELTFAWPRDESVTSVQAWVMAEFQDSSQEEYTLPLEYSYGSQLSVDLSSASADVKARTLSVQVTAPVTHAEVTAYGAHRAELDKTTAPINAGPGTIQVPWVGSPSKVVLLDVTLHNETGWAGFTYSPWFLDIPHDDVLFETNKAEIRPSEEPKLEATLRELRDVLDKYGSVVPVKLYVAGCTDTVGDAAHNRALSEARARSIAKWLRSHGLDCPIFFYGFGESLLAEKTGDGVDRAANRRALYIVGANPPPTGSGIPAVSWRSL